MADENASVKVDISGAVKKLRALDVGMRVSTLVKLVGMAQLRWVNQNFKDEGTEGRWAPLSDNTVAARRGKGGAGSKAMLQNTGKLRQSFVNEYRANEAYTGSVMPLALWHSEGTKPYTIKPKNGKALHFAVAAGFSMPKAGGYGSAKLKKGWAFAKEVHHPGLQARPLVPSKGAAEDLASNALSAYFDKLTADINALKEVGQ